VVQALILAAGRLAEHIDMPPALFCSHVVEAIRRVSPSGMRTLHELTLTLGEAFWRGDRPPRTRSRPVPDPLTQALVLPAVERQGRRLV
jgi:hypothetical protein